MSQAAYRLSDGKSYNDVSLLEEWVKYKMIQLVGHSRGPEGMVPVPAQQRRALCCPVRYG